MLATLIIVFRELIEAGLIVGIVLAATRGVPKRGLWISGGVAGGIFGACIVALFAGFIGNALAGSGQELFNAVVLLIAVLMLGWHNIWMSRHGRVIAGEMKSLGKDVSSGQRSLLALAIVVGVAVLREGSEIVLFLYSIAVSGNETTTSMISGGALGVLLGGCTSALLYFGLLRIPARYLFSVTSWLITLLAAGMAAQAIAFLQQAGWITVFSHTLWNSSRLLPDSSLTGRTLHAMIGYTARPTEVQLIGYVLTLTIIFTLMHHFNPQRKKPATAPP